MSKASTCTLSYTTSRTTRRSATTRCKLRHPLQNDARVVPAEADRVGERHVDLHAAGLVGDVVEVAVGVGLLEVDGGRDDVVPDGEGAHHRLERARCP